MQGVYRGCMLYKHDITWTCLLDVVQNENGKSRMIDVYKILEYNRAYLRDD